MSAFSEWRSFATQLHSIGSTLVQTKVKPGSARTADTRIIALALLARTLSNMKCALLMLDQGHVIEARILTRCCDENRLWVAGLVSGGEKFRSEMVHDDMKHRRVNMQTLFRTGALEEGMEEKIRDWLRRTKRWDKSNTLTPKTVANAANDQAYIFYQLLSMDAHPTTHALARHLEPDDGSGVRGLVVEPLAAENELAQTAMLLCMNALGVMVGVNELLGNAHSPGNDLLTATDQYVALAKKWPSERTVA